MHECTVEVVQRLDITFLPDGRPLVASDRHGRGRNLAVLEPLLDS